MEYVYDSKYTDTKVRADGYLVEVFMTRKYNKKKQTLPRYFWNSPNYKKEFFANLAIVRAIFKTYDERGISNRTIVVALTRKEAENITWLKDERIDTLIEKQILLEEQSKNMQQKIDTSDCSMSKPHKPFSKKSTLSKLKEMYGKKTGDSGE